MSRAPLTDDLIARLRGLRSMVGEIDQSIADLGEEAAEALAAASRPSQEPTTFAAIKRAIQRLEHGHYADPLDCFCGSDIIDRDAVLAVIDAAIAQGAPAAPPPWQHIEELQADAWSHEEAHRLMGIFDELSDDRTARFGYLREALFNARRFPSAPPAAPPPWQPIETAPKDGTQIDVWCSSPDGVTQWRLPACWWDKIRKKWTNHHGMYDVATHWLPLPSPPASAPQPTTTKDEDAQSRGPGERLPEGQDLPRSSQRGDVMLSVHRCKICGTRWLLWPDAIHGGGWNLLDQWQRPGGCCDNEPMGDQIEHLRDIPLSFSALPAAPPPWQPIETAPKDGTRILVAWPNSAVQESYFSQMSNRWNHNAPVAPTHWLPLPSPPASAPQPEEK